MYSVNQKTVGCKRSVWGAEAYQIDTYLLPKHNCLDFAGLRRLELDSPIVAKLKALTWD